MRKILGVLACALLVSCGSDDSSPSFNETAADKWAGTYRLESITSYAGDYANTFVGVCEIVLTHNESTSYTEDIKFDCQAENQPMVLRVKSIVNISDVGLLKKVSIIESSVEKTSGETTSTSEKPVMSIVVSPTYYTMQFRYKVGSTFWRFIKQ